MDKKLIPKGFYKSLSIIVDLPNKPKWIRNFKYEWQSTDKTAIVGPISPKILKFDDGTCLMSNRYIGTWVYSPECPLVLEWVIFGEMVQPYFRYDVNHAREWFEVGGELSEDLELKLIETNRPFELSFSKIPFKGVVIFTDHCDFDSDILLRRQREFFKKHGIKTTKGFFLNKHSHKGDWNSAFEGNEEEFVKWIEDGHELANHSLTQSILPGNGANEALFKQFVNPQLKEPIAVWIDHGYQTYNLTKCGDLVDRKEKIIKLKNKGLRIFWNYFDVSEACDNLNQLDYNQMSTKRIFTSKISLTNKLRIWMFHRLNESDLLLYRELAGLVKKRKFIKASAYIINLTKGIINACRKSTLENMVKRSQSVFPLEEIDTAGFQTIVVKDWVHAFNEPLSQLKKEGGLAIIHSYFSFLGKHHGNPLFLNKNGEISLHVENTFRMLSKEIELGEIWNPTLTEFSDYLNRIQSQDLVEINASMHLEINLRYV